MRKIWILIALLAVTGAQAQETGADTWGVWYMYFGMNRVSEKWSIHTEAQFRYYETTGNFNQLLLRTGANYHINKDAIVTLGYAFIDTDPSFEDGANLSNEILENRIFQQLLLYNQVWEFKFEHRYRLEQRFLDFGEIRGKETQHRARYRLQVTLPLTNTFFLNFYDEVFLNLQDQIFGQNRLYGAVGVRVTENTSVQFGYLKNHFNNINFDRLQFAVFYNPDLRGVFKKKSKD
ncbi:MAG: DUF2490 domain-containing protein [Eudoraea sp.]|nr:DUF2490 domain-containing protein [Eudoraea sp.]